MAGLASARVGRLRVAAATRLSAQRGGELFGSRHGDGEFVVSRFAERLAEDARLRRKAKRLTKDCIESKV
jgi:hypothetical protein